MASLWNKQKGKSRISRLVSDRAGNSLVVETGFSTSIADFLSMKSSKKRHRSKSSTSFAYDRPSPEDSSSFSNSVSDSPDNLPKLDMPICSIDANSNVYVEENIARRIPNFESKRYGSNYVYEIGDYGEIGRISSSNTKSMWLLILKGMVFVVVGVYTKSFVLGVSIGAFLFCLLRYLGRSIFAFFKPCDNGRWKLLGLRKSRRIVDDKWNGMKDNDSDRNVVVSTRAIKAKMDCVDSHKREIFEYELQNDHISIVGVESKEDPLEEGNVASTFHNIGIKREDELGENGVVSTRVIESKMERVDSQKTEIIEYELQNDNFSRLCVENMEDDELEQGNLDDVPSSCTCAMPFGIWGSKGGVEFGDVYKMDDHNVKVKNRRKRFWKKFVPKQSMKKRYKRLKGQEISLVWEEGNGKEDEGERATDEGAKSSLSPMPSCDEQETEGVEGVVNPSKTEMLNVDDECTKYSRMMEKKGRILRSLGFIGVVLAGLIGGRVLALVMTLICCLMLKIVKC